MTKNIILQHYNGEPKELERLSFKNIQAYAKLIGADHEIVPGKPFREHLTNPCQKAYCIDAHWDNYDNVLMLDPDVFIRKNLVTNIFEVDGNGIHGPTQVNLKQKLIRLGRITKANPYWAGSIYKFNKKERHLLRSRMSDDDSWMDVYNKSYNFEDEGILAELASRAGLPVRYLDFTWNQCSFLPNVKAAKMIHIRTKKAGQINGTWENGGKRDKIENYYELKMQGII
jgi:hypothetical protein